MSTTPDIKLPDKPKFRSLSSITKDTIETPWFIKGEPMFDEATGAMIIDYDNDDVIPLGVGNLTLRHMMNYETMYGENIETAVNKILYVFYVLSKSFHPDLDKNEVPDLEVDDDGNIKTPVGLMKGSFDKNVIDICTYILSCYGRIIGQKSNGEYIYEPFSQQDVVDTIKGNVFTTLFEDGTLPFMEIFERAGLWSPEEITKNLKEANEITPEEEDELGNSQ